MLNLLGYLKGGVEKWEKEGNNISTLKTIKSKSFVDILKLNKINILDVRKESLRVIKSSKIVLDILFCRTKRHTKDIANPITLDWFWVIFTIISEAKAIRL